MLLRRGCIIQHLDTRNVWIEMRFSILDLFIDCFGSLSLHGCNARRLSPPK